MEYHINVKLIIGFILCVSFIGSAQNNDTILLNLGLKYLSKIDLKKSSEQNITNAFNALELFEEISDWKNCVKAESYLAAYFYYDGEYDKGKTHALKAVQIARNKIGYNSIFHFETLGNLAVFYDIEGNYSKSMSVYELAIRIFKNSKLKQKEELYSLYLNLADTYITLGDVKKAFENYEYCLQLINNESYRDQNVSLSLHYSKAELFFQLKMNSKALEEYKKLLTKKKRIVQSYEYIEQLEMYAYNGLAEIYLEEGKLDSVPYYINKAIALQIPGNTLFKKNESFEVLADYFVQKGNLDKALENSLIAKELVTSSFKDFVKHPEIARSIRKVGDVYLLKEEYTKALEQYQIALQTNTIQFLKNEPVENPELDEFVNPLYGFEILQSKANAFFQKSQKSNESINDLNLALKTHQLNAALIQKIRQNYLAEGSKNVLAEKVLPVYEQAIQVCLLLFDKTQEEKYLKIAFDFSERNKAILLYENIKENLAKGFSGIPDSLLEKEKDLRYEIKYLDKRIAETKQQKDSKRNDKLKDWESEVFSLKETYQSLIQQLENDFPQYYEFKYSNSFVSVEDVQNKLSNRSNVFIEFMVGKENVYAFFIDKKSIQIKTISERNTLEEQIQKLRLITNHAPRSETYREDFDSFTNISFDLYNQLLKEFLEANSVQYNHLIIVPDDFLSFLPFEILLVQQSQNTKDNYSSQNLDYLLEELSISYHYSATLYNQKTIPKSESSIPFLGIAPSFGVDIASESRDCKQDQLYSLQCSQQEVESIQAITNGKIALGNEANKALFEKEAPLSKILHLATHACVNETDPELNKIFLSNDYLTNFDLHNLKLTADLTVLSACNTGMGKLLKGEGMISLTRGFILAGSKSILTSLWAVDDCATSDIMLKYYQSLNKGKSKDKAIRKAKLNYLKEADKNGSHPYYWAAFVQFGDTEAIYKTWWTKYRYLILGALFFLLIGVYYLFQKRIKLST